VNKIRGGAEIIFYFLRPRIGATVFLVSLTFLLGFLEMLNVIAIFPLLVAGLQNLTPINNDTSATAVVIHNLEIISNFLSLSTLQVASILLLTISIFTFVYKVFYSWYEQNLIGGLILIHKKSIFSVLEDSTLEFTNTLHRGRLNQLNSSSIEAVSIILDYIAKFFGQLITLILLLTIMASGDLYLLLVLGIIGLLYFLVVKQVSKKNIQESSREIHKIKIKESNVLNEVFSGIETIRNFNAMPFWQQKFDGAIHFLKEYTIKIHLGFMLPGALLQLIMGIGMAAFGLYMGALKNEVMLQLLPIMGVFIIAISRTNSTLSSLVNSYTAIIGHMPAAKNLYDFIQSAQGNRRNENGTLITNFTNSICFSNVGFKYSGKQNNALKNFSMEISKGEIIGVVGKSGSGKSTIINLLIRNFQPSSGDVYLDGVNIENIDINHYKSIFSIVSQDPFLLHGSILENITFGRTFTDQEINDAVILADALGFIGDLPDGMNTIIGEGGVKLSGGQKQRISLARALLRKSEVLILDEPSSALDSETEKLIFKNLNELLMDRTILIITHSKVLADMCDRIVDLNLYALDY